MKLGHLSIETKTNILREGSRQIFTALRLTIRQYKCQRRDRVLNTVQAGDPSSWGRAGAGTEGGAGPRLLNQPTVFKNGLPVRGQSRVPVLRECWPNPYKDSEDQV